MLSASEQVPRRASFAKQEQVQGSPSTSFWQVARYTSMPHVVERVQLVMLSPPPTPMLQMQLASGAPPTQVLNAFSWSLQAVGGKTCIIAHLKSLRFMTQHAMSASASSAQSAGALRWLLQSSSQFLRTPHLISAR